MQMHSGFESLSGPVVFVQKQILVIPKAYWTRVVQQN